jgi:hypothetical protein
LLAANGEKFFARFANNNITELSMRKFKLRNFFLVFFPALFFSLTLARAQDNHYWSQQYGAESTLLGGAMTGGITDNSAVYYNPGAIAFISNPSLSVDANVYRIDKIMISDGAGKGMNLNSAQISIYPQIIAGMLNLIKSSRFKFSYTLLTRNHNNILMNTRYTNETLPNDPAIHKTASFAGAYDYINQLDEQWLGLGTGYSVSDKLGVGLTVFGTYRGQSCQLTNYVREVNYEDPDYSFVTKTNDEAIKYTSVRILAKLGLSYIPGKWKYGLTLTTPSAGFYGRGSVQRENSNIIVSENPDNMEKNFLIMDNRSDVKARYKHPLSFSFGVDYHSEKTRLAITAEYFSRIGSYHLLEPDSEPFLYPPTLIDSANVKPQIDSYLHVENSEKPVLNIGIGFSRVLYKQLTLLLGASTDFTSYDDSSDTNELVNNFGNWNIYHFSAGTSYQRQKHTLTLGLSWALTPSEYIPPYTIINQNPQTSDACMHSQSVSVVLGYTYHFARNE